MKVYLLATFDTKWEEAEYLLSGLSAQGIDAHRCDLSLLAGGAYWTPAEKLAGMDRAVDRAIENVSAASDGGSCMMVAIGGGTGGQMALRVLQALPVDWPKVFVTTMPFDPRYAVADDPIILIPTLSDLCGLNATTRTALDKAAAVAGGLYRAGPTSVPLASVKSIGVTSLGVTGGGTDALCVDLRKRGDEVTVFHANGFGGAAFARWSAMGAFKAIIDYTPHELTRLHVAGVCANMPGRFTSLPNVPRVVLPGGVNFIGLGEKSLIPDVYKSRPHYSHSPLFTHVQVTEGEIVKCANVLGASLQAAKSRTRVLIPMGGFSSEDRPGGAIESPDLRAAFADTLETHIPVRRLAGHINDRVVAEAAIAALDSLH